MLGFNGFEKSKSTGDPFAQEGLFNNGRLDNHEAREKLKQRENLGS